MRRKRKQERSRDTLNVDEITEETLRDMSTKERRRARRVIRGAKKSELSPSQLKEIERKAGSSWRELGFDIDELPVAKGTFVSEKKLDDLHSTSQKAQKLEKQGNVDEAIYLYEQNVSRNSEIPIDYERLAIIYSKRGELQKAIEYCDIGLKSPACTNPAQSTARRQFRERSKKLKARLRARDEKKK